MSTPTSNIIFIETGGGEARERGGGGYLSFSSSFQVDG